MGDNLPTTVAPDDILHERSLLTTSIFPTYAPTSPPGGGGNSTAPDATKSNSTTTSGVHLFFVLVEFVILLVVGICIYRNFQRWRKRRIEMAQQLRSQQADRVLDNAMQLVPTHDLDDEII